MSILKFSSAERTTYLTALHSCLVRLVQVMKEDSTSPTSTAFHTTFADLIGLYMSDTTGVLPDCTVSARSGLPMLSKLLSIAHDQRNLLRQITWREKKDIAEDVLTAFYRQSNVDLFMNEFRKAHYYERLKDISEFDEQAFCEDIQGNAIIEKQAIQYAGYPLAEMSCISVRAEFYRAKTILELAAAKPPLEMVRRYAGMPVEALYPMLVDKQFLCGQLEKTELIFYFVQKEAIVENTPDEIRHVLAAYPDAHILLQKRSMLQNLDVLVAENHLELHDAQIENLEHEVTNLYFCIGIDDANWEGNELQRRGELCKVYKA
ncbi:MAG: hypothetical protein V1725_06665 [archaeon]